MTIRERIFVIAEEQLGITPSNETSFDEVDIDSLELTEFFMELEEEFEFSIPDTEIEKMKTLGEVVAYVENAKQ